MSDEDDYNALREKNISERKALFAELFQDIKKQTKEIEKLEKRHPVLKEKTYSNDQPPRKRRRTIGGFDSFKGNGIRLDFRRKYNTRSRKNTYNGSESDSENDSDENNSKFKSNRPKLKVLFPWAKPFQRSIDLMKVVCDVDEEQEEEQDTSDDDSYVENKQKRKGYRRRKSADDSENVLSIDEITEEMLENVAEKSTSKIYCKINGTSCHQCRQKTLDTKTVCRSGECIGVRGQFCGPCLSGRYGESAVDALKDPDWACPPCRGLCNCSICRTRSGLRPTGILAPTAQEEGYSSVMDYLQAAEIEDTD